MQCQSPERGQAMLATEGLEPLSDGDDMLPPSETMAEIVLPRRSGYVGRTLREVGFRTQHRSTVLAIQREGATLPGRLGELVLRAGDTLLVKGPRSNIRLLSQVSKDFVVVTETASNATLDRTAPAALIALFGMLVLMSFQLVPNVLAVLLAAIAMVFAGCLTTVEAYRRINWESVIVIAGMLPMSTALEKTGVVTLLVDGLVRTVGDSGPYVLLGVLFGVTAMASQVMSNTATTVLIAPVAYHVASELALAPQPFLMAVAMAASTAFATPIASPVNMLVLNAGGYRFADFFRVGFPLQLLLLGVVLVVVPLAFPF
jgi:di/tricarboxylate transporter